MAKQWALVSNDRGAVDLPSTMVTVTVLSSLFAAIVLTVFGIVPWVQDSVAQSSLRGVADAQEMAMVMDDKYLDEATLVAEGILSQEDVDRMDIRASNKPWSGRHRAPLQAGPHFAATMESATGRTFVVHDGGEEAAEPAPLQTGLMTSTWNAGIAPNCREITLPIADFVGTVTWGAEGTNASSTHMFSNTAGIVKITIDGAFYDWGFNGWEDANCLVSVDSWGSTGTTSLEYAFSNADNLQHVAQIPSTITNMRYSFSNIDKNFTLGNLDTSSVTDMGGMFHTSVLFNQPLFFNTSRVTNMGSMFYRAEAFNQPLSFNTVGVTVMDGMFQETVVFNQPVNFDTPQLTSMKGMFRGAVAFNNSITMNTSRVTSMSGLFYGSPVFNQPVNFNTSSVVDMSSMFSSASAFNQPLNFDTANVTSMGNMFSNAVSFNGTVPFDTSQVKDMTFMFSHAFVFDQPVNFDTRNVVNTQQMFYEARAFNRPVNFNTAKVKDMRYMFRQARAFNQPVPFNTSNVENLSHMFYGASVFNQPVNFDTSKVLELNHMFNSATAFNRPLNFNTANVEKVYYMFYNAKAFNQDLSSWNVSKVDVDNRLNFSAGATAWVLPKPSWAN